MDAVIPFIPLLPFPVFGISLCGSGMLMMLPVMMIGSRGIAKRYRRRSRR